MKPRLLAATLALILTAGACVDKPTEHRVRANAFLRAGDATAALNEIELGLGASEGDVALTILRGKALFELGRHDEAKLAFERAVELGDDEALSEAHLGLAVIASRREQWPVAREHFAALTKINAKDAHAHINLARACLAMNDLPCAVEHAEEAGRLRGSAEDVLFTLGRIYVTAEKYDEADKTFRHICDVVPGAASCPYGVGLVAAQQGDPAKAVAQLTLALERKLPNPDKLGDDPLLAPIRQDPSFQALVRKAAAQAVD